MLRCQCGKFNAEYSEENYNFDESGVDNIVLTLVRRAKCQCGKEYVTINSVERIHDLIFSALLMKPSILLGKEVVFLRKVCGAEKYDFAQLAGITFFHLSEYESEAKKLDFTTDKHIRTTAGFLFLSTRKRLAQFDRNDFLNNLLNIKEEANSQNFQAGKLVVDTSQFAWKYDILVKRID